MPQFSPHKTLQVISAPYNYKVFLRTYWFKTMKGWKACKTHLKPVGYIYIELAVQCCVLTVTVTLRWSCTSQHQHQYWVVHLSRD